MSGLTDRLARVAARSTCRLTHRGRKTGKPYQVTIWFMVDGDVVYLATASAQRQWVRNVGRNPDVVVSIDGETFAGRVEPIDDPAGARHVMDLLIAKYWYVRPFVVLARLIGYDPTSDASFLVRVV